MQHGLGHIPDKPWHVEQDLLTRHVDGLVGNIRVPQVVDYSSIAPIVDQWTTNSCMAQFLANSMTMRGILTNRPIQRPSPKAIYDVARLFDEPGEPLRDIGCRPTAAVKAIQRYGVVAESRWPLTTTNVNEPPPLDVWKHGLSAQLSQWYRVPGGKGAASRIRRAIAMQHIPGFAMEVDAAYERYDGSDIYQGPSDVSEGSHMQTIVGFGPGFFLVANSWGMNWGRRGIARIADSVFESDAVSDIIVPQVIPSRVT